MPNFGHSKFLMVFLHQNGWKNSECPILAVLNLFHNFLHQNGFKKSECPILQEKIWNGQFWAFQIFSNHSGAKILEEIQNGKIGHSKSFNHSSAKSTERNLELGQNRVFQKDWKKFRKVYDLHGTDCISTAATETAVAIGIAQWECCPVSLNIVASAIVQWERTFSQDCKIIHFH